MLACEVDCERRVPPRRGIDEGEIPERYRRFAGSPESCRHVIYRNPIISRSENVVVRNIGYRLPVR